MMFTRTAVNKIVPRTAAAATQRRMWASTHAEANFKKTWLSDPSTYPIIVVMTAAITGCSGFMAYKFSTDKAICITNEHKKSTLRN